MFVFGVLVMFDCLLPNYSKSVKNTTLLSLNQHRKYDDRNSQVSASPDGSALDGSDAVDLQRFLTSSIPRGSKDAVCRRGGGSGRRAEGQIRSVCRIKRGPRGGCGRRARFGM
jgi:hypothetical protein